MYILIIEEILTSSLKATSEDLREVLEMVVVWISLRLGNFLGNAGNALLCPICYEFSVISWISDVYLLHLMLSPAFSSFQTICHRGTGPLGPSNCTDWGRYRILILRYCILVLILSHSHDTRHIYKHVR